MQIVASELHRGHHSVELDGGQLIESWEGPARADLIGSALRAAGHDFIEAQPIDPALLGSVHSADYLEFLATAWARWESSGAKGPGAMGFTWPVRGSHPVRPRDIHGQLGFHSSAADCAVMPGTWTAALASAGIAATAAQLMTRSGSTTYGLCRPPGHHSTADQFGGYCYLNNAAVAAQTVLNEGASRVGILDVDYHHGNGTQSIFYDRSDVLFVSLHADPLTSFPYFAGNADEKGVGRGAGFNHNLPMPHGTNFDTWMDALEVGLASVESARCDALVISLGVDTYEHDPISRFTLTTADYQPMASRIRALGLPIVVVQEGGYAVEAIGDNVVSFLSGLSG